MAIHDQGTYWADEIFQSLEPAHKLAFGYGLLPWEYLQGARSWVYPGLIASVMKLSDWLGGHAPWQYLGAVRGILVANAMATIGGIYLLAVRLKARPIAAALGALLFALWPTAIYFSFRAFSEVASSGLIVFGLWLLLDPDDHRWSSVLGTSLLVLATMLRLQNIIFLAGGILLSFTLRQWKRGGWAILSTVIGLLIFGLIDRITWGSWFHSVITYVRFNGSGAASGWGVAPFNYYTTIIGRSFGLWWIPILIVIALGLPSGLSIGLIVGAFYLVHAQIDHKELRFIYPLFPLVATLLALGLSRLIDWLKQPVLRSIFVTVVIIAIISIGHRPFTVSRATVDVHVIDAAGPINTAYDQYNSENRLLWAAYQQPDLCGLGLDVYPVSTGGYTYLHRKIPIYQNSGPSDTARVYNYKIETLDDNTLGKTIATIGSRKLVQLPNDTCQPDPTYQPPSL